MMKNAGKLSRDAKKVLKFLREEQEGRWTMTQALPVAGTVQDLEEAGLVTTKLMAAGWAVRSAR